MELKELIKKLDKQIMDAKKKLEAARIRRDMANKNFNELLSSGKLEEAVLEYSNSGEEKIKLEQEVGAKEKLINALKELNELLTDDKDMFDVGNRFDRIDTTDFAYRRYSEMMIKLVELLGDEHLADELMRSVQQENLDERSADVFYRAILTHDRYKQKADELQRTKSSEEEAYNELSEDYSSFSQPSDDKRRKLESAIERREAALAALNQATEEYEKLAKLYASLLDVYRREDKGSSENVR